MVSGGQRPVVLSVHTTLTWLPYPSAPSHQRRAANMIHQIPVGRVAHNWVPVESLFFPRPASLTCHFPLFGSLSSLCYRGGKQCAPSDPATSLSQHGNFKAFRSQPTKTSQMMKVNKAITKGHSGAHSLATRARGLSSELHSLEPHEHSKLGPERAPVLLDTTDVATDIPTTAPLDVGLPATTTTGKDDWLSTMMREVIEILKPCRDPTSHP